jgi:hypothetical protein
LACHPGRLEFQLRYPNLEVKASLNSSLLGTLCGSPSIPDRHISRLYDLLVAADVPGMRELFHAFFATIPHDWYRNSPIARYEGYWASIFYSYFASLGLDIVLEDVTNQGRIDMAVRFGGHVSVRVQSSGAGTRRQGAAATAGSQLRRKIPRPGSAYPPGRCRVQPGQPQCRGVRRVDA